jgi:hypothetical protein
VPTQVALDGAARLGAAVSVIVTLLVKAPAGICTEVPSGAEIVPPAPPTT